MKVTKHQRFSDFLDQTTTVDFRVYEGKLYICKVEDDGSVLYGAELILDSLPASAGLLNHTYDFFIAAGTFSSPFLDPAFPPHWYTFGIFAIELDGELITADQLTIPEGKSVWYDGVNFLHTHTTDTSTREQAIATLATPILDRPDYMYTTDYITHPTYVNLGHDGITDGTKMFSISTTSVTEFKLYALGTVHPLQVKKDGVEIHASVLNPPSAPQTSYDLYGYSAFDGYITVHTFSG